MRTAGELRAAAATLRTSQVFRNVVSNYAAVGWTAALSLVTIPVYLRLLGPSEWGVVAACLTLQGFLALMDVGFGQIMPRSLARAAGDPSAEARLLAAYTRIYLALAAAGFVAGQLAASVAARQWFHASGPGAAALEAALRLILVQFFFQFANGAHTGFWSGMQLQEEGNLRTCAFATVRHAAAVASVVWVAPTALGYLVPFTAVTALEWLSNRRAILRRYAPGAVQAAVLPGEIRSVLRDAGAFTAAILVGLLVSQADRLVLSATQDLAQYGYYVIVANLGMAFMNLQAPLGRALFPRIVREDAWGDGGGGRAVRALLASVLAFCVVPCLLVIAVAPRLLSLWLGKPEVVEAGTAPLRLILGAVAINAVYGVIYQRMLSAGASRPALAINLASLAVVAAVVATVGGGAGIVLGGAIWISASLTQLALGVLWLAVRRRRAAATGDAAQRGAGA